MQISHYGEHYSLQLIHPVLFLILSSKEIIPISHYSSPYMILSPQIGKHYSTDFSK